MSLLDSDLELPDEDGPSESADREISLGTATVLGIFFLIALVCAGFFGFGYTLGRKSVPTDAAPAPVASSGTSHASKPAAGSLASKPAATPSDDRQVGPQQPAAPGAPPTPDAEKTDTPASQAPGTPKKGTASAADFLAQAQPAAAEARPTTDAKSAAAKAATKPAAPGLAPANTGGVSGNFVVQIAAVSSQETADILLVELKKKGYNVVARHVPQDNFLHIQVGPFASRKEAEAMRDRISADGFNAIIKP